MLVTEQATALSYIAPSLGQEEQREVVRTDDARWEWRAR